MPTIKEYSDLLWPNDQSLTQMLALELASNHYRHLSNLLNMNTSEVVQTFAKKGKAQLVTRNYLLNHIDECIEKS